MITAIQKTERELLAILLADLKRASEVWNRLAPKSFRGLVDAPTATPATAPAGKFWWDEEKIRYAFGTRGYIPDGVIRGAVLQFNQALARELVATSLKLKTEKIAGGLWLEQMGQAVKIGKLANAAVGKGGSEALEDEDLQKVSRRVAFELNRLERFGRQIEAGTAGGVESRARAYALTGFGMFGGMRRRAAEVAEFTLERNILGFAEHCEGYPGAPRPDCPGQSMLGWVNLGTLAPIGERLCLWNCHCHIQYARS